MLNTKNITYIYMEKWNTRLHEVCFCPKTQRTRKVIQNIKYTLIEYYARQYILKPFLKLISLYVAKKIRSNYAVGFVTHQCYMLHKDGLECRDLVHFMDTVGCLISLFFYMFTASLHLHVLIKFRSQLTWSISIVFGIYILITGSWQSYSLNLIQIKL